MARLKIFARTAEVLRTAVEPLSAAEITSIVRGSRERVQEAIALMHHQKEVHVAGWKLSAEGRRVKTWAWGNQPDAKNPGSYQRKNNPSVYHLIEQQLKVMPMTAEQVTERIFRARSAVNIALRFMKNMNHIHLVCNGRTSSGRKCSVYGLGAAPLEDVVGVEEGVVVPHKLSCTPCDAENV